MNCWFRAISLVFVCLLLLVQTENAIGQNVYDLHLQISDSLTNTPLYGATVTLHKHNHLHIADEEGNVYIDSLPAGKALLHITYVGYHHHDLLLNMPQNGVLAVLLCPEFFHLHESVISAEGNVFAFSALKRNIMNADEIQRKQGQNVSDLLKSMNGVTAMTSAGGIAKPVVRGLSGMRLVTLQGNSRMEGQQWGNDHGPELDPFQANGIVLIKGAAAVEYGPEAIGGVIQITPKPYLTNAGIKGSVQVQGQSNSKQAASSLLLEGRRGNEKFVAWRAQASGRIAGDANAPNYNISNSGFRENAQSLSFLLGGKNWAWENSLTRYASLLGIFAGAHVGNIEDLNTAIAAPQPLIIRPFTYQIGKPYQDVQHLLYSSELKWQLNAKSKLRFLFTQQVNRRKEYDAEMVYNQALRGLPAMDMEIQSFSTEQYFEQKLAHHWSYKLGATQTLQRNTVAGLNFIIPAFNSLSAGAFGLLKKEWLHSTILLGIRYDVRQLDVPMYKRLNKNYAYNRYFHGANAGITYNYDFGKNWVASASVQTGWRPPAVNELYSYGLHYGLASFEIGDSLLQPERSVQLEINMSKQLNNWHFSGSFFRQKFSGFIYRNPLSDPILTIRGAFPAFIFTQADALLTGTEFSLSYAPKSAWQWQSRFSYLLANNIGLNQPLFGMPANRMDHTLGYVFAHFAKLMGTYVELQSVWVARQNRFEANLDYADPPPAYVLLHANMGTSFKPFKKGEPWKLHFSAQNILNQSYRDYQSRFRYFTDDPGFNFIFRLQIPF
jgi:iron complex outermembrane receptor protein